MPKFSIVMPTRNHMRFIRSTVHSVLTQTIDDFEFIIVNNGSTDGTTEYLNNLRDPRVRIIHQDDQGAVKGINRGVRAASGEFVTWISSDNICAPYFLEALHAPFGRMPEIGFSYSAYCTIDDDNNHTGINTGNQLRYRDLIFNRNAGCPAFLYRNSLHEKLGYYDETLRFSADTEMLARIFKICPTAYVLEPTHHYRYHAGQETAVAERTGGFISEGQTLVVRYWHDQMGGILQNIVKDIYPGIPEGNIQAYFLCVWSLAASFYYYLAPLNTRRILLNCARFARSDFLLDILTVLTATAENPGDPAVLAEVAAALAHNKDIDHAAAMTLAKALAAGAPPYDPRRIVSLPRQDLGELFERPASKVTSFSQFRHPIGPIIP